jgi:hypothetical protein
VHVTDPVIIISFKERSQLAAKLNRANVTYNALTCNSEKLIKVMASIFKPVVFLAGGSMSGSAQYFARRTGGEALSVPDPKTMPPRSKKSLTISPRVTVWASR